MTFYERLKQLMNENNTTQKMLSEKLSINKNSFKYWKDNQNTPKYDILSQLSNYFDCSIDYLLGKSDIKKQAAQDEQPVSDNMKLLIDKSSTLSPEEIQKTLEYVEFLKSQRK